MDRGLGADIEGGVHRSTDRIHTIVWRVVFGRECFWQSFSAPPPGRGTPGWGRAGFRWRRAVLRTRPGHQLPSLPPSGRPSPPRRGDGAGPPAGLPGAMGGTPRRRRGRVTLAEPDAACGRARPERAGRDSRREPERIAGGEARSGGPADTTGQGNETQGPRPGGGAKSLANSAGRAKCRGGSGRRGFNPARFSGPGVSPGPPSNGVRRIQAL